MFRIVLFFEGIVHYRVKNKESFFGLFELAQKANKGTYRMTRYVDTLAHAV